MRILHINSLSSPDQVGGAELLVENLARNQAGLGHVTAIASLSATVQAPFMRDDVHIYRIGYTTPFFILDWSRQSAWKKKLYKFAVQADIRMVLRMAKVIDSFRPDVINTHSLSELSPLLWPMIGAKGIKLVHTLHDFTSMCTNGSLFHDGHICSGTSLKCRAFSWFHRLCEGSVNAVAAVGTDVLTRHIQAGFFRHIAKTNRHVIWNPIEPPNVSRPDITPRREKTLRFGYLGRLESAKGADFLLDTVAHLPQSGWSLLMAGRAPDGGARYKDKAAGLPVDLPGFVNIDTFFDQIDCLIVPALWPEAFGRTVAEAYLRGIPVIGSNLAGIAEQVKTVDPKCLFEPGDTAELLRLMNGMMALPDSCATAVPDKTEFSKRVDPVMIARNYISVYSQILHPTDTPIQNAHI